MGGRTQSPIMHSDRSETRVHANDWSAHAACRGGGWKVTICVCKSKNSKSWRVPSRPRRRLHCNARRGSSTFDLSFENTQRPSTREQKLPFMCVWCVPFIDLIPARASDRFRSPHWFTHTHTRREIERCVWVFLSDSSGVCFPALSHSTVH